MKQYDVFSIEYMRTMAHRATADQDIWLRTPDTYLTFSLVNTDNKQEAWVRVNGKTVTAGIGNSDSRFTLTADSSGWQEFANGMPINRLLRQQLLHISGDSRSCLQNWLLVYQITKNGQQLGV